MGIEFKRGYCDDCEELIRAERPGTNHVLHLLLSLITFGFWIIIWIMASIKIGGWQCPRCGGYSISNAKTMAKKLGVDRPQSSLKSGILAFTGVIAIFFVLVLFMGSPSNTNINKLEMAKLRTNMKQKPRQQVRRKNTRKSSIPFFDVKIPNCTGSTYPSVLRAHAKKLEPASKKRLVKSLGMLDGWFNINAKGAGLKMSEADTNKFLAEAACGKTAFQVEQLAKKMLGVK